MKKSFAILLAAATIAGGMTGCKDKPVTHPSDLSAPKITLTSPAVVPVGQYTHLDTNDSLMIDIRFEDDIELRDYEIRINSRQDLSYLKTQNDPWKEVFFGDLNGTIDGKNFKVFVDFDASPGPYEFVVKCHDMEGKESIVTTYLFVQNLGDTVLPQVNFIVPTASVDSFAIGSNIIVQASCTDNSLLLDNVRMRIRNAFTKETLPGSDISFDSLFTSPYLVDTFVTIPAGTVPGDYNVEVYPQDVTYNIGYGVQKIYIKPN